MSPSVRRSVIWSVFTLRHFLLLSYDSNVENVINLVIFKEVVFFADRGNLKPFTHAQKVGLKHNSKDKEKCHDLSF